MSGSPFFMSYSSVIRQYTPWLPVRFSRTASTIRPHSSLGYRPSAPEAILPRRAVRVYGTLQPQQQGIKQRQPLSYEVDHFVGAGQSAIGSENVYQRKFISHLLKDRRDSNRIAGAVGFSVHDSKIYVF